MILDPSQLKNVVLQPDRSIVNAGAEYSKKLRMHINGVDINQHLPLIKGFEREAVHELRIKYSKSNKDMFARNSRPLDNVWNARGGSIYYNLPGSKEKQAIGLANDVRSGYSIKKWLEMFWQPHLLDDPFGIILMEILPQQEAIQAKQKGKSFVYPTYIPSRNIVSYKPKGNRLEYLILALTKDDKVLYGLDEQGSYFRVIDDAFDYVVKVDNQTVTILPRLTFPNFFGEVPAIINSDIINPENEHYPLSLFDKAIELADQFFIKGSVKITHDFLHGFPKYSEFADDCSNCGGTGYKEAEKCTVCKGTGKRPMTKVSDMKLLTYPTKEDVLILPNQVGGYISPDKTFHEISTADLFDLENFISVTLWGAESKIKTQGTSIDGGGKAQTATQIMSDIKPEANRLYIVSEMAENRHKFILDYVIRLQVEPNYPGASVSYGRRYMLEGPDEIWNKYSQARKDGAPQSVLDDLLNEYYDAKYMTDPMGLAVAKKLMYLEPFVHYRVAEVKALNPSPEDYKAKLYFGEFLSSLNEAMLLSYSLELLKEQLMTFAGEKELAEAEVKPVV